MGTRGTFGFVVDGEEKLSYNHFDSYPDGLGVQILNWVTTQRDFDRVKESARNLLVVDEDSKPTQEQIKHLQKYSNLGVSEQSLDDWYCLLRETQGDPTLILEAGAMADGSQFPLDSLFCEWGYVVDLDAGKLEVYQGFQTEPHESGRFAKRKNTEDGYYPIKLIAAYSIYEPPTEATFLAQVNRAAGYDEEE